MIAWIGLGSNLQDPVRQLGQAFVALSGVPHSRLIARSSLYRTTPVGGVRQPDFVNAVAGLETGLAPDILFAALLDIERRAGRCRERELRWGPRVLDLDLLLYGQEHYRSAELQIPHPRLRERAFVLAPLAEVAGEWRLAQGESVAEAWRRCHGQDQVQKLVG